MFYLNFSFPCRSHSQPHFTPCLQPSGWFWEHPAILHHCLGPAVTREHMVLCSTIRTSLENKFRWLERLQAIWKKEKNLGPNSRKKLSLECSALLFSFGFTGTGGFGKIEAVAAGMCAYCLMGNKMMIRWAGREANANVVGWKSA